MTTTHLLAYKDGTLHWVPDDKKAMIAFSKAHRLRNEKDYLKATLGSNHVHSGWQRLASIKYLQHKVSGKVVAVVGHATDFLLSLDRICELAGLDPKDMPLVLPGRVLEVLPQRVPPCACDEAEWRAARRQK